MAQLVTKWIPGCLLAMLLLLGTSCGRQAAVPEKTSGLDKVVLQTDWFAQPEHGGFYQALAKGYYREAGLDVEILPGGPNAMTTQKVLRGRAHFAMNRADSICDLAMRGVPVQMVMATLQHDPQGILLHKDSPVRDFSDLDGRRVMAFPGLAWIDWIQARYQIQLDIIPHDFGLERFLNDPDFIQQCMVTNEPFYARQAGVETRVLPLRDSGFDPYHGIYCLESYAGQHPDVVRRFISASIRGWKDFILGDPSPALALIAERNPRMNPSFMQFCWETLRSDNLVTGEAPDGMSVGRLDPDRMQALETELQRLGLLEPAGEDTPPWYRTDFLP